MAARSGLGLQVEAWSAILYADDERRLMGAVGTANDLPSSLRRRMPGFILDATLCSLPLLRDRPESDLVYCSCNGDLAITADLLTDLFRGELLSPAKFSISVHNAPAGMVGLAFAQIGNHTAIAGGPDSLAAGLTDAYARLATGEAETVVLVFAEACLPEIYREFDEGGPNTFIALTLSAAAAAPEEAHWVEPGREGAAALARALDEGARALRFAPPQWEATPS